MKYLQIERKCGAVIEVTRCIPKESRKTVPREKRKKKTPEDIKKANDRQAKEKIIRKINTNFQPGDIFAVLTYDQKERPSPEQAKKELQGKDFKYTKLQRNLYKKEGGAPQFDPYYTVFGEVLEGLDVVDSISRVRANPNGLPYSHVKITKMTLLDGYAE
jgi:cyclophilin family peptidyl-prolyl cis-trans isomerase